MKPVREKRNAGPLVILSILGFCSCDKALGLGDLSSRSGSNDAGAADSPAYGGGSSPEVPSGGSGGLPGGSGGVIGGSGGVAGGSGGVAGGSGGMTGGSGGMTGGSGGVTGGSGGMTGGSGGMTGGSGGVTGGSGGVTGGSGGVTGGSGGVTGGTGGVTGGSSVIVFNLAEDLIASTIKDTPIPQWELDQALLVQSPKAPQYSWSSRVPLKSRASAELICRLCKGIFMWRTSIDSTGATMGVNTTSRHLALANVVREPRSFSAHPGSLGEYAVVTWIAPVAGNATIVARFSGLDETTTDHIVTARGEFLVFGNINGYDDFREYLRSVEVAPGDTVEFAIGRGADQRDDYDTTGLFAEIRLQPSVPLNVE